MLCPHYNTESFCQEPFKKVLKRTPDKIGITLDEHAAIEIIDNKHKIILADKKAEARKTCWLNGKYHIKNIRITITPHLLEKSG